MSKGKGQIIEIFGMKLEIVPDDGSRAMGCEECAIKHICDTLRKTDYDLPCSNSEYESNRHFEKIV